MRITLKRISFLFALTLIFNVLSAAPHAFAEPTGSASFHEPGRFAKKEELLGGWKRIALPAELKEKFVERWPADVQYFEFENNGLLNSVMISNDKDPEFSAAALSNLLKDLKGTSYASEQDGMLVVKYDSIPGFEEHWGANIFLEDHKSEKLGNIEFKAGDLLLTLDASTFDANKRGVIYMRHLRRVK